MGTEVPLVDPTKELDVRMNLKNEQSVTNDDPMRGGNNTGEL